jgi:hypothetical protein
VLRDQRGVYLGRIAGPIDGWHVDATHESELGPAAMTFFWALLEERIATDLKIISIERQPERIHIEAGKNPK